MNASSTQGQGATRVSKTSLKEDCTSSAADASAALIALARLLGRAAARAELRKAAEGPNDTHKPSPVPATCTNSERQETTK